MYVLTHKSNTYLYFLNKEVNKNRPSLIPFHYTFLLTQSNFSAFLDLLIIHFLLLFKNRISPCWRRSSGGCCRWLTHMLEPGNWRFVTAQHLRMYALPTVGTASAPFRGAALKEQGVETLWTEYMTEPS